MCGLPRDPATFPDHERAAGWQGVASVADEIRALGRRSLGVDCDVVERAQVEAMVAMAVGRLGRIDILVNNAALPSEAGAAPILDVDDAVWYRTVDVNLNGALPRHQAGRSGDARRRPRWLHRQHLVDGRAPGPAQLRRLLRDEVGDDRPDPAAGGRAGAARHPGQLRLPGLHRHRHDGRHVRPHADAVLDSTPDKAAPGRDLPHPDGSPGPTSSEQAAAVAFLASDDAAYITGQTLNVDGGLRMD